MRKARIALPAAALVSVTAVAVAPAANAAKEVPPPAAAMAAAYGQGAGKNLPIKASNIKRYHIKPGELKQIAKAKKWANTPKSRSVVRCESGFDYQMIDGPYHGAWQFLTGTWLGAGGGRYAHNADKAPRFAQDHVAWKLWKRSGWGPWSCA